MNENIYEIRAIILDWAGTTVDYGCFAPLDAFITAFEYFGIVPTVEETRAPMGLSKRAHIARMLEGKRLAALWKETQGKTPTREDIDRIYERFEPALFKVLKHYAEPIAGVADTVRTLRESGMRIGSTTGYTRAMMEVLAPLAAEQGYAPDSLVCPDETGLGRPFPYMLWRNLEKLGVMSTRVVLKVGDTVADMEEGRNAGCLCVGILKGSSMLGLSEEELAAKSHSETLSLFKETEEKFRQAGADYVIEDITALPELIESINEERGVKRHA